MSTWRTDNRSQNFTVNCHSTGYQILRNSVCLSSMYSRVQLAECNTYESPAGPERHNFNNVAFDVIWENGENEMASSSSSFRATTAAAAAAAAGTSAEPVYTNVQDNKTKNDSLPTRADDGLCYDEQSTRLSADQVSHSESQSSSSSSYRKRLTWHLVLNELQGHVTLSKS